MQRALRLRDDIDKLCVPRNEGRRGLTSIQDSVDASIQRLEDYIKKSAQGYWLQWSAIRQTTRVSTEQQKKKKKRKWEEKQLYRHSKRQTSVISREKSWTWLKKRNLSRETKSLQIATQNNTMRTNYIKARMDKTQQNSKCRLCGEKDKTINHIIYEYCKLAQNEYNTRHDWVGEVIHGKFWKKFKFDHTKRWYIHNPESFLENETYKIHWDFEIQTDYPLLARRPDLVIVKEKSLLK